MFSGIFEKVPETNKSIVKHIDSCFNFFFFLVLLVYRNRFFLKVYLMFQLRRVVSRNMSGVFQRKVNLQKQKLMKLILDITRSQNDQNQTTEKYSLSN